MGADPLAGLPGLHLPPPVGLWPPAPGWWVLAGAVLLGLLATLFWWIRHHRRQRYRREALRALAHCADTRAVNALLKQVAMTRYGRETVAALWGDAWRDFLNQSTRAPLFTGPAADALLHYQPGAAGDAPPPLRQAAARWIRGHR